jgi:hypothetical protein
LGPWNAIRFPYEGSCLWHFHGLRLMVLRSCLRATLLGTYRIPRTARRGVYDPYLRDLSQALQTMASNDIVVKSQVNTSMVARAKRLIVNCISLHWTLGTTEVGRKK